MSAPNHPTPAVSGAAPRMQDIAPFHVMELVARAQALEATGRNIVHLEVGEPDFEVAAPVARAAQAFLAQGHVHYTAACGLAPLREAIAAWYWQQFKVVVPARRIVVTAGASAALQLALAALTAPGDDWLIPDPAYPCNRAMVRLFEGRVRALPVDAKNGYHPTVAQLEQAWCKATRGLLLASPGNPTGSVLEASTLAALIGSVQTRRGAVIVDEIYQGLVYERAAHTALSISDEVFIVNSFSKYFGMTGWRLGWLVVPEAHIQNIEKLAQNLYICAPTLAQHAALAAFSPEAVAIFEQRRMQFAQRRDVLVDGLRDLGFGVPERPQGAFYVYADSSHFADDSFALAYRLLEQAGVAATPGCDFGTHRASAHIRFAYTRSIEQISEALHRLRHSLA